MSGFTNEREHNVQKPESARAKKESARALRMLGKETGVISDAHGNVVRLKEIVSVLVKRDVKRIVFLGDYIDRDEDRLEVLRFLLPLISTPSEYSL